MNTTQIIYYSFSFKQIKKIVQLFWHGWQQVWFLPQAIHIASILIKFKLHCKGMCTTKYKPTIYGHLIQLRISSSMHDMIPIKYMLESSSDSFDGSLSEFFLQSTNLGYAIDISVTRMPESNLCNETVSRSSMVNDVVKTTTALFLPSSLRDVASSALSTRKWNKIYW